MARQALGKYLLVLAAEEWVVRQKKIPSLTPANCIKKARTRVGRFIIESTHIHLVPVRGNSECSLEVLHYHIYGSAMYGEHKVLLRQVLYIIIICTSTVPGARCCTT